MLAIARRRPAILSAGALGLVVALENFSVSNGKAEALFPGWLRQLLTTPVRGLERYREMLRELTDNRDAIKVYVEVGREGSETSSGGRESSR